LFGSFEWRGRKGLEGKGRKEGKSSLCLGVKETIEERKWRGYFVIYLVSYN